MATTIVINVLVDVTATVEVTVMCDEGGDEL